MPDAEFPFDSGLASLSDEDFAVQHTAVLTELYRRQRLAAEEEAQRHRIPPSRVPTDSAEHFHAFLRDQFREGPKARPCELSGEQVEALVSRGVLVQIVTPFGVLEVR